MGTGASRRQRANKPVYCMTCATRGLTCESVGFCTKCLCFMCFTCVQYHRQNSRLRHHDIYMGQHHVLRIAREWTNVERRTNPEYDDAYQADDRRADVVAKPRVATKGDVPKCVIVACVVLGNGMVVLADERNWKIKVYDSQLQKSYFHSVTKLPIDVCASLDKLPDGYSQTMKKEMKFTAYYTMKDVSSIGVVTATIAGGAKFRESITTKFPCAGITCWTSGLAVTSLSVVTKHWELRLLDYTGVSKFLFTRGSIDRLVLTYPTHMCTIGNGRQIVIADTDTNSIICFDTNVLMLKVVFVVQHARLTALGDMATDADDNIYIVSKDAHKVFKMAQKSGKHIRLETVLSEADGLKYPAGIAYDVLDDTVLMKAESDTDDMIRYRLRPKASFKTKLLSSISPDQKTTTKL